MVEATKVWGICYCIIRVEGSKDEGVRRRVFKYMKGKRNAGRPDYLKLELEEFREMREDAAFLEPNTASSIVNGRLWKGKFNPSPPVSFATSTSRILRSKIEWPCVMNDLA